MSTNEALAIDTLVIESEDKTISAEGCLVESRLRRRALIKKVAETAAIAIEHIENGSFELVEQALTECKDDLCQMGQTIKQDKKKRRGRKNEIIAQAQSS